MISPSSLSKLQDISPEWYERYMQTHAFDYQESNHKLKGGETK